MGGWRMAVFSKLLYIMSQCTFYVLHHFTTHAYDKVADLWREVQPDIVVSVITMVNRVGSESLDYAGFSHVPYITVITDFEHSFDHPWMQSRRQILVVGNRHMREQAMRLNYHSHS